MSNAYWEFSDGHYGCMSDEEGKLYMEQTGAIRTRYKKVWGDPAPSRPLRVDKSGWAPHFNHGLGMYIESKRQYNEELKKRGLVEAGSSKPLPQTYTPPNKPYLDDDAIGLIRACGGSIDEKTVREVNNG